MVAYQLLHNQVDYTDLGADYFTSRTDLERPTQQLEALGHNVHLDHAA